MTQIDHQLGRAPARWSGGAHPVRVCVFFLGSICTLLCAGCANPGPPKPPTLALPEPVRDLAAERVGDRVLLRWTTPSRTTDDIDIRRPMTAEICREVGSRPLTPAARLSACTIVRSLPVSPGPSEAEDELPVALSLGPAVLLTYRIKLKNESGRSAGNSAYAAFAAAGAVPPAISGLNAVASERGAVLEWNALSAGSSTSSTADLVELRRVDLSLVPVTPKKPAPAPVLSPAKSKRTQSKPSEKTEPDTVYLRVAEESRAAPVGSGRAGTVDETAVMGDTYTYVAERVAKLTIGSHVLEVHSAPSATVTLAMTDTFPPRPPTGLATIAGNADAAGNASINLSWDANTEADLAGYRVYRQLARPDGTPEGPLARLTALPITAPAYRDVAVKPGQRYIYHVTAVDASGNESAPSAKALEAVDSQP